MTLKKDDKTKPKPKNKPAKEIVKSVKLKKKDDGLLIIDDPIKSEVIPIKPPCDNSPSESDEEDDGSGPSSGLRLTSEEREENLSEVYRLQRKMLRGFYIEDEEEEDVDDEGNISRSD